MSTTNLVGIIYELLVMKPEQEQVASFFIYLFIYLFTDLLLFFILLFVI